MPVPSYIQSHTHTHTHSYIHTYTLSISPSHTCGHISRVFHLWLRFITFGGRSAHLAYLVQKNGRKISIIIITLTVIRPIKNMFRVPLLGFGINVISTVREYNILIVENNKIIITTPRYLWIYLNFSQGWNCKRFMFRLLTYRLERGGVR